MMIALSALAVAVVFFAGLYSGYHKTFPVDQLMRWRRRLKRLVRQDAWIGEEQATLVLEIADVNELRKRREQLIAYMWRTPGLPRTRLPDIVAQDVDMPNYLGFSRDASVEHWAVQMEHGIDSQIFVFTPRKLVHKTAIIYQQGHEGDVIHGAEVIQSFLRRGYRVAALAMPLLGPNSKPRVRFRRHGLVQLQDHDFFTLLDHEYGVNSVRFFVEPVIACVNQLSGAGFSIAMLGWSGGGWTTAMCAAIDDRIARSFPVAGSLPFPYRKAGELADYENHIPGLYDIANYPEIHVLGSFGKNRSQLQILNEFDTVAWSGRRGATYEAAVQDRLRKLGDGRFSVMIDSSWVGHGISKKALKKIHADLLVCPSSG